MLFPQQVCCFLNRYVVSSTGMLFPQQVCCFLNLNRYVVSSTGMLFPQQVCCFLNRYVVSSTGMLFPQQVCCFLNRYVVSSTGMLLTNQSNKSQCSRVRSLMDPSPASHMVVIKMDFQCFDSSTAIYYIHHSLCYTVIVVGNNNYNTVIITTDHVKLMDSVKTLFRLFALTIQTVLRDKKETLDPCTLTRAPRESRKTRINR